ncbi:MAG: tyrosine-type recombinase/integrase [Thaumarchaeota archaeon]|nr:tyrosine-type recombinase/integrase [Nitrososphaerota archaeon]
MSQVSHQIDLEGLEQKIYRRSHSVNSVTTFRRSVSTFKVFLKTRNLTLSTALQQDPYKLLDGYAAWMDEMNFRSSTQNTKLYYATRLLTHNGVKIDKDKLRDAVPTPKKQIFTDEALTPESARTILLETRQPDLRLLLFLEKDTLARPEELISLKLGNINLTNDPAYLKIPEYAAKNNIEREVFFTQETKERLVAYLQKEHITKPSEYIFLKKGLLLDPIADEKNFQKAVSLKFNNMHDKWHRNRINIPAIRNIIQLMERRGHKNAYTIHIYSFKKFGFTKIADTISELAAHAIAGHQQYLITYYKKSRDERAADFRKVAPKLQLFTTPTDVEKQQKIIENEIKTLPPEALAQVLEFVKTAKRADKR